MELDEPRMFDEPADGLLFSLLWEDTTGWRVVMSRRTPGVGWESRKEEYDHLSTDEMLQVVADVSDVHRGFRLLPG